MRDQTEIQPPNEQKITNLKQVDRIIKHSSEEFSSKTRRKRLRLQEQTLMTFIRQEEK